MCDPQEPGHSIRWITRTGDVSLSSPPLIQSISVSSLSPYSFTQTPLLCAYIRRTGSDLHQFPCKVSNLPIKLCQFSWILSLFANMDTYESWVLLFLRRLGHHVKSLLLLSKSQTEFPWHFSMLQCEMIHSDTHLNNLQFRDLKESIKQHTAQSRCCFKSYPRGTEVENSLGRHYLPNLFTS